MHGLLWLSHRFNSELMSDQSRGKNVLFTQFMRSIRSRGPDAEGFSRQLDLKEISCLGGHLRGTEGQAKYVAHVLILSVPPLVPAITNQHPFPLRPERALQSIKHDVPGSHYQGVELACRMKPRASPALGVMVVSGVIGQFWMESHRKLWQAPLQEWTPCPVVHWRCVCHKRHLGVRQRDPSG